MTEAVFELLAEKGILTGEEIGSDPGTREKAEDQNAVTVPVVAFCDGNEPPKLPNLPARGLSPKKNSQS